MGCESFHVVTFDLGPLVLIIVYGRASGSGGSGGSAGSAFCFPYNSVTVRWILFKFGRFRQ